MDRCLLCGHDQPDHAADCPDARGAPVRSVFADPDEIARARAALEQPADTWGDEHWSDDAWRAFTGEPDETVVDPAAGMAAAPGSVDVEAAVHPQMGSEAVPPDAAPDAVRYDAAVDVAPYDAAPAIDADEEPWAIPIRDPGVVTEKAARPPLDPEQRRLVALVGGGLALLVLAVVGALLIGGGDDDDLASDTDVAGSVVEGVISEPDAAGDDSPDPSPSVTAAVVDEPSTTTAEASTTTTTATTATTTSTTTTTAAPVSSDTGDVPVLSPGQIGRGWVAQVTSVPQRSGGEALQRAYAVVQADAPSAVAIRSDDWPALRSGFWVIVVPDFDTGADALAGCSAAGQGDDCVGRFLSSDAAQNARVCARAEGGGTRGDCGA